jgi:hypothetical protein
MNPVTETIIPSATSDHPISIVQALPFNTPYNGPAPVKQYFLTSNNNGKLLGYFRGRELKGKTLPVPTGMTGLVLRKDTSNNFLSADVFEEITVWEHDVPPDAAENRFEEILEYAAIADCLHLDHPE